MKRHGLWFGFLWGFLFGIIGLWFLAVMSMMVPFVELITAPLFWFGRWMGSLIQQDGTVGNAGVMFLLIVNGFLYGVIGLGLQWGTRYYRENTRKR